MRKKFLRTREKFFNKWRKRRGGDRPLCSRRHLVTEVSQRCLTMTVKLIECPRDAWRGLKRDNPDGREGAVSCARLIDGRVQAH